MCHGQNTFSESRLKSRVVFLVIVMAIITGAIVRSSITTRLDSFTLDEAYHTSAGAMYIQTGDFRINPEQPPLVKLWTGAYVTLRGYQISPFRRLEDKNDERDFIENDAYVVNDPFVLQTEVRTAMLSLNALLLALFAFAARRVFGDIFAIAALLFLAIDPTVAAHMPVVMTDLPIMLTAGVAALTAAKAFQSWRPLDLALCAAATGLALSAKHSGIIVVLAVGVIGVAMAVVVAGGAGAATRAKRAAAAGAAVLGAIIVLWSFYGFRYYETPGSAEETFNRPLAEKINDVRSPLYRAGLNVMIAGHLFPRAYIWGLADTIRAGAEGRANSQLAFGQEYYLKAPFYFFPGIVAAKLPIGLLILSLAGAVLWVLGKIPREYHVALFIGAAVALLFLVFLILGSSYAGARHALPLWILMSLLGATAIRFLVISGPYIGRSIAAILLLGAIVSGVPQMRPWEYFNEFAGGAKNGSRYFNDESVDLSQRIAEMADYYHRNLEPQGEIPYFYYLSNTAERNARGLDWVGRDPERDAAKLGGETFSGTFMIGSNELAPSLWWDVGATFRGVEPADRMGNVFVFKGTFPRPASLVARRLFYRAVDKIYTTEPNIPAAIEMLEESVRLDPTAFFVALELGNQYLLQADRANALRAYRRSLEFAPKTDNICQLLADQVSQLEEANSELPKPIRNPGIE